MKITLDQDQIDLIVKNQLEGDMKQLRADLRNRKSGELIHGIFTSDKNQDIEEMKKLLNAYEMVLTQYEVLG